jgi:hypothetical protein
MQNDTRQEQLQLAQVQPESDPGFRVPPTSGGAAGHAPAAAAEKKVPGNPAAPLPSDKGVLSSTPPGTESGSGMQASAQSGAPGTAEGMAPGDSTVAGAPLTDTSARELVIGGGVFVVLLIIFFFARNAYTHHLVVRRVAPATAGSAGWLLFVGLGFLSAAAVLALVNASKYLSLAITGPLLLVGIASLAGALLVGRR